MDGWQAIKEVRLELSEANKLAKDGQKSIAKHCMRHAHVILVKYLEQERGPEHGFKGNGPERKR